MKWKILSFLSKVFPGLTMFSNFANCYHVQLKPTLIKDLKPNTFTNIAGIVNQPFQSSRISQRKTYYQLISLQGTLNVVFWTCFCQTWWLFLKFVKKCNQHFHSDTSCGTFRSANTQLRLHIFANKKEDVPPLENVGDFIFLHNVEISEWEGD